MNMFIKLGHVYDLMFYILSRHIELDCGWYFINSNHYVVVVSCLIATN